MDIHYFYKEPVTVTMLPVCECGYIFRNGLLVAQEIVEAKGYKYGVYSVEPPFCPNCHRRIEAISENRKWN